MRATEFRKHIVDIAEKQLANEGYELITRVTPLPEVGLDEYKSVDSPVHRCALSVHVCVVSEQPLAATLTIARRLEGGEVEFETPLTVRPVEAEARVRAAIAIAITKSGCVSLSRILSLVPVQMGVLSNLHVKDVCRLLYACRAVRTALSTKQVDVSFWKKRFDKDFPDENVEDASSPTAYRRLYGHHATRAVEEKRNRKRANRPRMIDSPDLLLDDPLRATDTPPRPGRPHAPDPDMPIGPLRGDPNIPDYPLPFNPLFNPLQQPTRDPRLPFGPYGNDVLPNRPRAPHGFPQPRMMNHHNANDYI